VLQRLLIQNYVLIDELEISFSQHLNVITGETGAGKSIIVGALGLILGERADAGALGNREKKCVIEGVFVPDKKKSVLQFLAKNELDGSDELILRREIAVSGKSRAFINDTPVNLAQLQELSRHLVDLHQQFDTLDLATSDFQREVIDALAAQGNRVSEYESAWRQWQELSKETGRLKEEQQRFDREADYHRFQFSELEEAGFRDNELEEAEAELRRLSHSEGIRSAVGKLYHELMESDSPLVQQLRHLLNQLQPFTEFHPGLPVLMDRLRSAQIELQDIAEELDRINDQVQYDPERVEQLQERLSLGYKLQKKHGVRSTAELLGIKEELATKLKTALDLEESIRLKEQEAVHLYGVASALADAISAGRKKQLQPLEKKVNSLLVKVGMPNARLKAEMKTQPELNAYGKDIIEFLFDANVPASESGKGAQFQPVRKVASGGELSRLMLCIKSLVAQSVDWPTMIFDEIDTGISGEAARQVGIIMKDMAASRQLICITHQPQIAGMADAHFYVYKETSPNAVHTSIRLLDKDERITAIARMLSGEQPSAAALENARELLKN